MGAGTLTATKHAQSRAPAKQPQAPDLALLVSVIILIVFGLIMVYSASWDYSLAEYGDAAHMFVRQLLWLGMGLAFAALFTMLD